MCIGPDGLVTAEGLEGLDQKEAARRIVRALETAVTDLERGAGGSRERPTS